MNKHLTNIKTALKAKLKSALVFMLLMLFILSSCPVKRGIQSFLLGNNPIENSIPNYNKAVSDPVRISFGNLQICSTSIESILNEVDLRSAQSAPTISPFNLVYFYLLPLLAFALSALYYKADTCYFSKVTFPQANTPIYIKNRLLLI